MISILFVVLNNFIKIYYAQKKIKIMSTDFADYASVMRIFMLMFAIRGFAMMRYRPMWYDIFFKLSNSLLLVSGSAQWIIWLSNFNYRLLRGSFASLYISLGRWISKNLIRWVDLRTDYRSCKSFTVWNPAGYIRVQVIKMLTFCFVQRKMQSRQYI